MNRKEAIRILHETKLCSPVGQAAYTAVEDMEKQIPKTFIYPQDNEEEYRCPSCDVGLGFLDDYFGDLEITRYCKYCGQRLCK